ncbi:hypothetical protein [uncultured Azohydromonas sp.]|uniref:hypothetical protein n=1 Tax=uncultured Azohydromonas sp. TaxID=487342 RepID=UPI0026173623|nr:hypothetical protein [uncultured Azohydromonas sp.]
MIDLAVAKHLAVRHGAAAPGPALTVAAWQRALLLGTAVLLLSSGGTWLAVHYLLGAGAGELPHPTEPWLMRLHGLGAFAALFAGGGIAGAHVGAGWRVSARLGTQRRSGLVLCTLLALTVLSAYLLYYFAPEDWRGPLGWAHAGLGAALAATGGWHARRRLLRSRKSAADTVR